MKSDETACPFCGARANASALVGTPELRGARDRNAILFGAAVASAIAVAACNNSNSTNGNGLVMPYGAPITYPDAGVVTDAGATSAIEVVDASMPEPPPHHPIVLPYGVPLPPPTTLPTTSSVAPKPGTVLGPTAVPAYGAPPPMPPKPSSPDKH